MYRIFPWSSRKNDGVSDCSIFPTLDPSIDPSCKPRHEWQINHSTIGKSPFSEVKPPSSSMNYGKSPISTSSPNPLAILSPCKHGDLAMNGVVHHPFFHGIFPCLPAFPRRQRQALHDFLLAVRDCADAVAQGAHQALRRPEEFEGAREKRQEIVPRKGFKSIFWFVFFGMVVLAFLGWYLVVLYCWILPGYYPFRILDGVFFDGL